jgi:ssRNA-specific RNase YbeY (16S rRNA maturation enzyme)
MHDLIGGSVTKQKILVNPHFLPDIIISAENVVQHASKFYTIVTNSVTHVQAHLL